MTHVCRSLLCDALVDELNARPTPIVAASDRVAWRRGDAMVPSWPTSTSAHCAATPLNFVGLPAAVQILVTVLDERFTAHDPTSYKCSHCW